MPAGIGQLALRSRRRFTGLNASLSASRQTRLLRDQNGGKPLLRMFPAGNRRDRACKRV